MHRRLSLIVLFALIASLLPSAGSVASAATFRTVVGQVPAVPGTGNVRIWMNSDTALGETAGIETLINGVYTKRLGTFNSTTFAGANWYVDIPGQAAGTTVSYQLFTRNQSGSDYGFTGFNWSYTASGAACAGASVGDNNIFYAGLFHDSFSSSYRSPIGPVTSSQGIVTLRLRTCQNDAQSVSVRVWNDRANTETISALSFESNATDPTLGPLSFWKIDLPISTQPTALYYTFRASDGTASGYYRDDDPKFLGGGFGQAESNQAVAYDNSYQLSVYDPNYSVPSWMQRGIIYQIFPDRFRDGNSANNPAAGRFSYGANVSIVRSNSSNWNTSVCDPRAAGTCFGNYGDNFYGGDLQGITQKISDGYFSSLGVTVLYLNPIFSAPSNHKYDTADFLTIDSDFGTLADFQAMVAAANARGIRIMLDGVFNHVSSDSKYFDRYGRYNAAGQLINPNGGANDGSGACEAVSSGFRSWFYFPATANAGKDGSTTVYCADANGNPTVTYEAWYGYSSLPKLQANSPQVRGLIWANGLSSVGPYWTSQGASGWRFDVGADVDAGLTNDASNDYWEGFRAAVRNPAITGKSDTVMLGEEWGDATPWLLGNEWDSVMNYRFRSAVLSWLFTGCSGSGCTNGTKFQENDSNDNSSSGAITYLSPSQFNARLRSMQEDYPPMAFRAMMNLEGSHDTQRVRFLLKKVNNNNDAAAVQRMKEWWLFAFSYAGAPTLYYGDEVGLSHDGVFDGSYYQDDPYNRAPFPWPDASGNAYVPDTTNLQAFARQMASIRQSYPALQDGDVQHGLVIDDTKQLYGFARTNGSQTALVLLNRSGSTQSATFSGLNAAPYNLANGTALLDAISGTIYTVTNGTVTISVTPTWGVVLLEQNKIQTPAPANLSAAGNGGAVQLSWPMVTTDSTGQPEVITSYGLYRGSSAVFTPSAVNRIATLQNPSFGGDPSYTDAGAASGGYFYIVRSFNAAGKYSDSPAIAPTKQSVSLSTSTASGVYGSSVTLQASMSAGATGLSGYTINFSLNGASVGSALTNTSGVASLSVSLGTIGAGNYPGGVTASFAGDNAYNPASANAALSIAKAAATISLSGLNATYNGSGHAASATTSPTGLSGIAITYSGSADAPVNAGSYAVVATLDNPNYTAANASDTLVIAKASATITISGQSATYNGQPKPIGVSTSPAGLSGITITYNGSATAPTNAGVYAVVAMLDNPNYSGSATDTLTIAKAPATISLHNLTQGYTGSQRPIEVTTDPAGLESDVTISYNGSGTAPINAGSYSVSATLTNANYTAPDVSGQLQIVVASQTISFAPLSDATYGDAPFIVSATSSSGLPVSFSADGNCSIANGTVTITGAGSCSITASQPGNANYGPAPSVMRSFSIAKAIATISLSDLSATYNGAPRAATATTNPSGLSGISIIYAGSSNAPVNAGSYAVVATLTNPNYMAAPASGTLTIAKASASLSLSNLSATYDGAPKAASVTSNPTNLTGITLVYNGSASPPTGAGSYAVLASLDNPNYSAADITGELVITKATAAVNLSDATMTYDGAIKSLIATTTPSGLGLNYSYSSSPINAGSYTVQATVDDPNYTGSASATLTIDGATATISLSSLSQTYDGNAQTVTVTTSPANLSGISISYAGSPNAPINAGSYPVVVSLANPNYVAIDATGTLTIAKATATISLSGLSQTYDGQPKPVGLTTSPAGLGAISVSYAGAATAPTNAGSYVVVATLDNPNYSASTSDTLVIAKAGASLILGNLSQTYDGTAKSVSVVTDPADLNGVSVTYNGAAVLPVVAGNYTVLATLSNPNYSAPSVSGTLAIGSASQTISFAPLADKTYGDAPFSVSASASSGLPVSFSATGDCSIANGTVTMTGAGSCSVTAAQPGDSNIGAAASVTQSFSIAKASATISLGGLNATYDGSPKVVTASTSPADLSGVILSYNGVATAPTSAGSYAVLATLSNPNYQAAPVGATLTIAKAPATISLGSLSATYDGTQKSATASTSPANLSVNLSYSATPIEAGSYTVLASITDANYQGTTSATLVIAQASQTINLSGVPTSTTAGNSFTVNAIASSGLPVSLGVSGPCSLSNTTVTTTGAGTCVLSASQSGNSNYTPAPPVSQSITVTSPSAGYVFSGFFAPVDNQPIINIAKAGSAIPVKFSLGGNFGLNIFANGYPAVATFSCPAGAPTDPIDTTVTAVANSLSYDAASNRYTFVWKTDKSFAGSCRQLVLKFSDGTIKTAAFNFTR